MAQNRNMKARTYYFSEEEFAHIASLRSKHRLVSDAAAVRFALALAATDGAGAAKGPRKKFEKNPE